MWDTGPEERHSDEKTSGLRDTYSKERKEEKKIESACFIKGAKCNPCIENVKGRATVY